MFSNVSSSFDVLEKRDHSGACVEASLSVGAGVKGASTELAKEGGMLLCPKDFVKTVLRINSDKTSSRIQRQDSHDSWSQRSSTRKKSCC